MGTSKLTSLLILIGSGLLVVVTVVIICVVRCYVIKRRNIKVNVSAADIGVNDGEEKAASEMDYE